MRHPLITLSLLLFGLAAPAGAQLSIGISSPGISIGIKVPLFPELERVPGYPVYYAPGLASNYFFYDGLYWVYESDNWYSSSWYNGPWGLVGPNSVPLYLLRVPVSYYRSPPRYFSGWQPTAPPHWGEHWGNDWQQRRSGWDQWNHHAAPAPAPLPTYQRDYAGERYPHAEPQQQAIRNQNYKYQPRDAAVRQRLQAPAAATVNAPPPQAHAAPGAPPVQHANPSPGAEQPNRPPAQRQVQAQPQPPHDQRPAPQAQEQAPRATLPREPPRATAQREPPPAPVRRVEAPREAPQAAPRERAPPQGSAKDRDPAEERGRGPRT